MNEALTEEQQAELKEKVLQAIGSVTNGLDNFRPQEQKYILDQIKMNLIDSYEKTKEEHLKLAEQCATNSEILKGDI